MLTDAQKKETVKEFALVVSVVMIGIGDGLARAA